MATLTKRRVTVVPRGMAGSLRSTFLTGLTLALLLVATTVHGAPTTIQIQGAAGELQFPGSPLTLAEAQELSQRFAGEASLKLVYDPAALVLDSGSYHYSPGTGPVFELKVTNPTGTYTYSFDEYRLFLDDQASVDTVVITPFLPTDATVTLSTGTTIQIDIGLVWQDPSGTALSSSTPPPTLDLSKLNVRGYSFIFINPDGTGNGSMKGALALQAPAGPGLCGNGTVEGCEECDDGNTSDGDGCSATCQVEPPAVITGSLSNTRLTITRVPRLSSQRSFNFRTTFTLGAGSNGINPLTEAVDLRIGSYEVTIPAGWFSRDSTGRYWFVGKVGNVALSVVITPQASGGFRVEASGIGPILVGTTNPVTVGVKVGGDSATAQTTVTSLP